MPPKTAARMMATKHSGMFVRARRMLVTQTTKITRTEVGSTTCSAACRTSSVGEIPSITSTESSPDCGTGVTTPASTCVVLAAAPSAAAASAAVRCASSCSRAWRPCSASSFAAFFLMRSSSCSRSTASLTCAAAVAAALAAAAAAAAAFAVAVLICALRAMRTDASTSSTVSVFTPTSPACFAPAGRLGACSGAAVARGCVSGGVAAEMASWTASWWWRGAKSASQLSSAKVVWRAASTEASETREDSKPASVKLDKGKSLRWVCRSSREETLPARACCSAVRVARVRCRRGGAH
mmetsp:Transcript_18493/g.45207  ORF Transcript_18493/g.45207 Transcript_18493/m.45207 type:complete len:296 (-) Transcript_18493:6-893(-)